MIARDKHVCEKIASNEMACNECRQENDCTITSDDMIANKCNNCKQSYDLWMIDGWIVHSAGNVLLITCSAIDRRDAINGVGVINPRGAINCRGVMDCYVSKFRVKNLSFLLKDMEFPCGRYNNKISSYSKVKSLPLLVVL